MQDLTWAGLGQGSLFHRPKANVVVSIQGTEAGVPQLEVDHVAKYNVDMVS